MRLGALTTALLCLDALAGCQARTSDEAPAGAPTLDQLRNATYVGLEQSGDTLTLRDGRWEGGPPDPGSAVRPTAAYVRDLRLAGDLDGDGVAEAVAFLAYSGGGTGQFLHVAVVGMRKGGPRQIAGTLVGDRVQVRGARIENGQVVLDLVQAGPEDAACCPADVVTRVWALEGGTLVERDSPLPAARLSPATIGAQTWKLEAWSLDEPAVHSVTLSWRAGRLAGRSGCNRYSAAVTAGESPGDITVGPTIGTRMACPPLAMEVERRFLQALGSTRKIGFHAGRLALTFVTEQGMGTMLFAPDTAAHADSASATP